MVTLRSHDIMIFGGMNGKLPQKMFFLKNAKKINKPKNQKPKKSEKNQKNTVFPIL